MELILEPAGDMDANYLGCGKSDGHPNCQCKREN